MACNNLQSSIRRSLSNSLSVLALLEDLNRFDDLLPKDQWLEEDL